MQISLNGVLGFRGRRESEKLFGYTGAEWRREIRGRRREERMRLEAPVNEREERGLMPCFH